MKKSLPQAILTLLVVGLTFTALSDRASARGGGGGGSRGGSYGGSFSSRSSYSYSRPSSFSNFRQSSRFSNNNRALRQPQAGFSSSSAFSRNTAATSAFSRPANLNKGTGLGFSKGNNNALKLAGSSGKPANMFSKPFNGNSANKSGKQAFAKKGKNGKNGKNHHHHKHHYPWEPYWGGYDGGYDDGDGCDDGFCDSDDDGSSIGDDATSGDVTSDPAAVATADSSGMPASQLVIVNPAETQTTLAYTVNGVPYTLSAGQVQPLNVTTSVTIEFDRGLPGDPARYSLTTGTYLFQSTDRGWDLVSGSPSATPTPAPLLNTPQTDLAADGPQIAPAGNAPQIAPVGNAPQSGLAAGGPQY